MILTVFKFSIAHFYYDEIENKLTIDTRLKSAENVLNEYQSLIQDVPYYLDWAIANDYGVLVVIPDLIDGVGPVAQNAEYIEGARTTLAWIQTFRKKFEQRLLDYEIIRESECDKKYPNPTQKKVAFSFEKSRNLFTVPWESDSNSKIILITGAAGFIGSHLCRYFLNLGFRVIGIDNLICSTGENIAEFDGHPCFVLIKHDVAIPFDLMTQIDYVVHAASIPSPEDYYKMPFQTMQAGINGTINTLWIAKEHGSRYLFLSTSEIYGDPEVHPQSESYAGKVNCLCSRSPYDQSKRGAETLIKLYFEKYSLDVRIARIFNTYGPGMRLHDGRVITNFISALIHHTPLTIYGDGTQTRSLCYISDMVAGLSSLLFCQEMSDRTEITQRVFNLGNPEEFSVNQIASEMMNLGLLYRLPSSSCINIETQDKADPRKRRPDISRAQTVLQFSPQVSFNEGIRSTLEWFMHQ